MKAELTFDEFFKYGTSAFFRHLGFQVETEFELFKLPKKLDLLVIKTDEINIPESFDLLTYFKNHNLLSYKSPGDRIKESDIRDAVIYLNGYINVVKDAHYSNSTMTILCNHEPEKFIKNNREHIQTESTGHRIISYGPFVLHLVNLNLTGYTGLESFFLKDFAETEALQEAILKSNFLTMISNEKMLDILKEILYIRNRSFEKGQMQGINMPATLKADITELVKPHYEQGRLEQALETARNMLNEGFEIPVITRVTGLTEKQLKENGVIGR